MRKTGGFTRKELLVVVVIISLMVALILPAVLAAREAARASVCIGNVFKLGLAMRNYESAQGHFPRAFAGPDGSPDQSWRALMLPYMDAGSPALDQYRFDEPWDSPHNQSLEDQLFYSVFQCPSGIDLYRNRMTNYVVVRGPQTAFPTGFTITVGDIKDGPENTILVVESHGLGIHWREPRDLDVETMSFAPNASGQPCINSPHPAGAAIVFVGGRSERLADTVTDTDIRALLTIGAGDSPKRIELEKPDGSFGR